MAELSVLFVGSLDHGLASCPGLLGPRPELRRFEDAHSAVAYLDKSENAPDLIVLAESRPGQFSSASIHELRRAAPLAGIWRLLGSWCEGEKRSGKPPPACVTTLWHQWEPRAARALARVHNGDCPPWGLPATATPDEQTLALAARPAPRGSGAIVVCAHHAETASALADACRMGGYDTTIVREGQPWSVARALAVLWDMPANQVDERTIRMLRASAGGTPIVALMSFPRTADIQRGVEAGIAGVISKPFLLGDLLWHFKQTRGVVS